MHPIFFQFKQFTIYSYGVFAALAVMAALVVIERRAERFGFDRAEAANVLLLIFFSGIAGARALFVLQHLSEYESNPWRALHLQEGGLTWYGGFGASLAASLGYLAFRRQPILKWMDFIAPALPLAHGIGRIGCFLNGCCFGRFTDSAFGVRLPGETLCRWPVQLIEGAALFLLSLFLFFAQGRSKRQGRIFTSYVLVYSLLRFGIEFLRGDQSLILFWTLPQWISVFLFLIALLFFMKGLFKKNASF